MTDVTVNKSFFNRIREAIPNKPLGTAENFINESKTASLKVAIPSNLWSLFAVRRANKRVNRTRDKICDAALSGELAWLEILFNEEDITVRATTHEVSPGPNNKPPTMRVFIRDHARWSGGLLTALFPDLESLKLGQGFPSGFKFKSASYLNLTRFQFHSWKFGDTDELENTLLKLLSRCPNLQDLDFIYPNLQSRWRFLELSPKPHESVELPSLKLFTQRFYHGSGVAAVPIGLFNRLVLPPQCNVKLSDEDHESKRSWNGSFPISALYNSSQCPPHLKVEVEVHIDQNKTAVVEATFSDPHSIGKISLVKWTRAEYHPIFEQILDFLGKKLADLPVETLELEFHLDQLEEPTVSEGVSEGVLRLLEQSAKPPSKVTLVIKCTMENSSEVLEVLTEAYVTVKVDEPQKAQKASKYTYMK